MGFKGLSHYTVKSPFACLLVDQTSRLCTILCISWPIRSESSSSTSYVCWHTSVSMAWHHAICLVSVHHWPQSLGYQLHSAEANKLLIRDHTLCLASSLLVLLAQQPGMTCHHQWGASTNNSTSSEIFRKLSFFRELHYDVAAITLWQFFR